MIKHFNKYKHYLMDTPISAEKRDPLGIVQETKICLCLQNHANLWETMWVLNESLWVVVDCDVQFIK